MSLPRKVLGADELVILHLRTHAKALVWPTVALLAIAAVAVVLLLVMPDDWFPVALWVVIGVAVLGAIFLFVAPFLRWRTSTYTITDRRVITRHGILNKKGHDLPLSRISNITYDRSLLDRMFGCGTLVLTTAAEAPVTLPDVPRVEDVHVRMTELLFNDDDRSERRD